MSDFAVFFQTKPLVHLLLEVDVSRWPIRDKFWLVSRYIRDDLRKYGMIHEFYRVSPKQTEDPVLYAASIWTDNAPGIVSRWLEIHQDYTVLSCYQDGSQTLPIYPQSLQESNRLLGVFA